MLFKIKETGEYIAVALWADYKNGEVSTDCFADFEINVKFNHEREQGGDAYIIDKDKYDSMIEYWRGEVDWYNSGEFSEQFGERAESVVDFWNLLEIGE